MQQLAPNQGQIQDCFHKEGPAFFKKIPTEGVHNVAILDLIILNFDRHGGNVLVNGDPPRMIPIDHGKSLPTRNGFFAGKCQIETKNFFLSHGAAQMDERFSPEMLAIIDLIHPDQLAQEMKASRDALVKQHLGERDKLGDESVEMARRSVLFLKKAASHLTVRELMHAYRTVLEPVFDAPPDKLEAAIHHAVLAAVDGKAIGQQLDAYGRGNAKQALNALGWFTKNPNNPALAMTTEEQDTFLDEQGGRVLKILQGKIENPAVRKRFEGLLREVTTRNLKLDFDPDAMPIREALIRLNEIAVKRKKEDLDKFRPLAKGMGADLSALDGLNTTTSAYQAAEMLLADLKEFHDAGGDKRISGEALMTPEAKLEAYGRELMKECAGNENPEQYYNRMLTEFGHPAKRETRKTAASLAKARYLKDCLEFHRLGGKAQYQRLLGQPYNVYVGVQTSLINMLKAESDASVDDVDLNEARKKAIEVGIQRLKKVAPPPPRQARATAMFMSHLVPSSLVELRSRIERQMKVLQANLDGGQYEAAEKILAELEAEVDRAVQGDNSDIVRLDARIEAARGKVTELRQSEEQQAVARALQAVEDLRKGWKLPQCETALGKLENSAETLANKQAAANQRRRLGDNPKMALESRLPKLHMAIQDAMKNPHLKRRYGEFSRRYWNAIQIKDEWKIDEATKLFDQIERELDTVERLVPQLVQLQQRIDKAVDQLKDLPANALADPTYDDVESLIKGARTCKADVGIAFSRGGAADDEVQRANSLLDELESTLAQWAKYPEKQ